MNIKTFRVDGNNRIIINGIKIMWATLPDIMPYGDEETPLQDKFEMFVIDKQNGNIPKKQKKHKVIKNDNENRNKEITIENLLEAFSAEIDELTQFYYNKYKDTAYIEIDDIRSEIIIFLYDAYEKLSNASNKLTYNNKKSFIYRAKHVINLDKRIHKYVYDISTDTEMDIHNDYDSKQNYDMYYTIDKNIINEEMKRCIWDLLDTLTEKEKEVLILRFGLIDNMPKTLEEVGKKFFVQGERVRQIENKALRKLRHPTRAKKLHEFWYD